MSVSKVAYLDPKEKKATKLGYKFELGAGVRAAIENLV